MLVRVQRTYGGQEGRRVKIGTILAVEEAHPTGGQMITRARYNQLVQQRLVTRLLGDEIAAASEENKAPGVVIPSRNGDRPAAQPGNKMEPDSRPSKPVRNPRQSARAKMQEESPKEPRPLGRRTGSQTGAAQPASSSPEVHQVGSVTLKQRGVRGRRAGSPSTTPGSSAPGLTPSTPATALGGGDTGLTSPPADLAALG